MKLYPLFVVLTQRTGSRAEVWQVNSDRGWFDFQRRSSYLKSSRNDKMNADVEKRMIMDGYY